MMMQWFINEVRERFAKTDAVIAKLAEPSGLEARIEKLEGELRALKARLGKNKEQ